MPLAGRNEPCPCGSGRKFKYCCGRPQPGREPNPNATWNVDIRRFLAGKNYDSVDDLQTETDAFFEKRNRRPIEDFNGLSAEQMHHLLDFPFDSPIVTIAERLETDPGGPFIKIFGMLADAVQSENLRPTSKGNLPRRVCRDIAEAFWNPETIPYERFFPQVNGEDAFEALHTVRVVAELAGFLRKYKGKFILGRTCRALLEEGGLRAAYPPLFTTYVRTFNWGYRDGYPELPFVQRSFLYSLFLLQRFGSKWKPDTFYSEQFVRAFPLELQNIPEQSYTTRQESLHNVYSLRALRRFAGFMGLACVKSVRRDGPGVDYRVRDSPLLREMVSLNV